MNENKRVNFNGTQIIVPVISFFSLHVTNSIMEKNYFVIVKIYNYFLSPKIYTAEMLFLIPFIIITDYSYDFLTSGSNFSPISSGMFSSKGISSTTTSFSSTKSSGCFTIFTMKILRRRTRTLRPLGFSFSTTSHSWLS